MQIGAHDSKIYDQSTLIACQNCLHRFPPDKIDLHEAYCTRNFKKCPMCGIMIDKNGIQEHQKQLHSSRKCQYCHQQYIGRQLQMHQQQCYAKPILCQYCSKTCPRGQLQNHKNLCGMRNKQCNLCKKFIPLKQYQGHQIRCQNRQRLRRDNSLETHNRNNIQQNQRGMIRQNSQNRIDLVGKKQQQKKQQQPIKINKVKPKNYIQPEQIKQMVSTIPISIQYTIKNRQAGNAGTTGNEVKNQVKHK